MSEIELQSGAWVRWTLGDIHREMWCEGKIVDPADGVSTMSVVRAHNWPAAEAARMRGDLVRPCGRGTIEVLTGEALCRASACDMPSTGGPCRRCGYPMAYTRPDCVYEALGMSAVYVNGTAMNVIGSSDVEIGVVNVFHLDPKQSASYVIPRYLKAGDRIKWVPNRHGPWGAITIMGTVMEMLNGCPMLRVDALSASDRRRPHLGDVIDTSVAPGTMQRLPEEPQADFKITIVETKPRLPERTPDKTVRPIVVPVCHNFVAEDRLKIGDYVRWENPTALGGCVWIEGELVNITNDLAKIEVGASDGSPSWTPGSRVTVGLDSEVTFRRIPRPAGAPPAPPPPTLYDGLTSSDCYCRWCDNRAAVEVGGAPMYHLTPDQIAAGRRIYQEEFSAGWSSKLRVRVMDGQERDAERRPSVVIEHEVD